MLALRLFSQIYSRLIIKEVFILLERQEEQATGSQIFGIQEFTEQKIIYSFR